VVASVREVEMGGSLRSNVDFFLFFQYWGLNSGLTLAGQALYLWSHTSRPFCSDYFRARVSLFAQGSLDHDPPVSCLPL
jgi:hypothetical protein